MLSKGTLKVFIAQRELSLALFGMCQDRCGAASLDLLQLLHLPSLTSEGRSGSNPRLGWLRSASHCSGCDVGTCDISEGSVWGLLHSDLPGSPQRLMPQGTKCVFSQRLAVRK